MQQRLIVVDGQVYNDVNEMPPDIRALYEDALRNANRNGMPDPYANTDPFANQAGAINIQTGTPTVMNTTRFVVDGQTFDSLDQLPPEARAKYEQAMGKLDANRNGIPDIVEGMFNLSAQAPAAAPSNPSVGTNNPPRPQPIPAARTIEPESSSNWLLILLGIVLLGGCLLVGAAGVWYFFLR